MRIVSVCMPAVVAVVLVICAGCSDGTTTRSVAVGISPATATVGPGGAQQFTASVTGSSSAAVIWSVQEGAAGGSVDQQGLYTAPATPGTYHVLATSQADPSKSATAAVVVQQTGLQVNVQ